MTSRVLPPSVRFTVTDTFTGLVSNTATVSINVIPPPVANSQSVATGQGVAKAVTLTSTDPNSDPLTYAITVSPAHGTLSGTAPNLTYTPTAGYSGPDSFQFTVTDTFTGLVSNTATAARSPTAADRATCHATAGAGAPCAVSTAQALRCAASRRSGSASR